jgi:hypothetical protein
MGKEPPDRFVRAVVCVQVDFGTEVPKLVRRHFHADSPEDCALDRNSKRRKTSWCSFAGNKQGVRTAADDFDRNLITKRIETVRENLWEFELYGLLIFCFVLLKHDECRFAGAPAASANAHRTSAR